MALLLLATTLLTPLLTLMRERLRAPYFHAFHAMPDIRRVTLPLYAYYYCRYCAAAATPLR